MIKKKEKKEEFNLKELMSTPRGRAILFFGAYLVFFIAIAIFARAGGASNGISSNKKYETGSPLQFSFAGIENNNYKFNYVIEVDGVVSTMNGVRDGFRESSACTALDQYYMENDNYFVNANGIWIKTSNPYTDKPFHNIENISNFIEAASYVSKTDYESGNDVYNFNISSATINKILNNSDLDIEEIPNEIIIGVNEDNYVNEIKLVLNSYCKAVGSCTNSMKVTLKYEMFGEIDEISSPLV